MSKQKRRLNPFPQRAPEWLDDPKMRAEFIGGLTDAAMQQGQFRTQQRGAARAKRGEAENLRRWELLRGERKGARDWRRTVEEQQKVRQEARDKLTRDKWAYTQEGPERTFDLQKRLAEMRDEMEFERQAKQIKDRLDALATYEAGEKKMRQEGAPEERIQEYRRQSAIRSPELAEQLRKAAPKAPAAAKAPTRIVKPSPVDGKLHTFGWNPETEDFDIDFGVAPAGVEKEFDTRKRIADLINWANEKDPFIGRDENEKGLLWSQATNDEKNQWLVTQVQSALETERLVADLATPQPEEEAGGAPGAQPNQVQPLVQGQFQPATLDEMRAALQQAGRDRTQAEILLNQQGKTGNYQVTP